jgi:phytoene dehydrogenase-like protein
MLPAYVIGAGPNGLSAAITLAQHRLPVQVFEAEPQLGGAARTLELTLPGFLHDFGSAVHPLAAASPFFTSLPLADHGLHWIHSPAVLAHPFDDGTAICLERSLADAQIEFGADGPRWRMLVEPIVENWFNLAPHLLGPVFRFPRHPWLMARFGFTALLPARTLARAIFRTPRVRALFAGLAAHSFLSLDAPLSSAFGVVLGAAAHVAGWPIPRGGSQSLTNALCAHLEVLGGVINPSCRIDSLTDLPERRLTMCNVTPRQMASLAGNELSRSYVNQLRRYQYGPGVFKVDYALSCPIPWRAPACLRAATVHLGASLDEILASEADLSAGRHSAHPFVLLAQPSLFDATRAPAGKQTAWAYCHVPHGSTVDMLQRLEGQIERFAPGFRQAVIARHVFSPSALQEMDANLVGGDINGGAMDWRQLLFRPTWKNYRTSAPDIYICSSSTPPGAGVHGMCGYHAAQLALRRLKLLRPR